MSRSNSAKAAILFIIVATMALGSGCRRAKDHAGGSSTEKGVVISSRQTEPAAGDSLDAEAAATEGRELSQGLAPVIFARVRPAAVVMRFREDVVDGPAPGKACGPDTIVLLKPEVKGSLSWQDPRTLVFKPSRKLPFDKGFEFELVQVETDRGIVRSPWPGAWKAGFDANTIGIGRADFRWEDRKTNRAMISLAFSAGISKESLQKRMDLTFDGAVVRHREFPDTGHDEEVVVKFNLPRVGKKSLLKLQIGEGLASKDGKFQTYEDFSREYWLEPKEISVRDVRAREGASGYFISVICEDHAEEYYWSRCDIPAESLADMVTINPSVKPTFVPDRRGFRIFGDFGHGDYTVTLAAGLSTTSGGILANTFSSKVTVPARSAKVQFVTKGRYLPRQRLASVPVRHLNVDSIEVTVKQVPEQNLVFWLSGEAETPDFRTSEIIAKKTVKVEKKEDKEISSWLDLSDLVKQDARGLFEFTASGGKSTDAVRLVLTQMSLVAKRGGADGRDLSIWVMDAEKLRPVKGVSVEVMAINNSRLAKAVTNRDGFAGFKALAAKDAGTEQAPFAIIARSGQDLTVLRFSDLEVPLSEYPVAGLPYKDELPYRAALYTDRGVYRPGEISHLVAIVWEGNEKAPGKEVPVIGKLMDPRGKEIKRQSNLTNPAGMAAFDLDFEDFAPTGKYDFLVEIGGKQIAAHSFHVEEFVPERMKASVKPSQEDGVMMTEASSFDLEARYLFGADARGEHFEAECTLEEGSFARDDLPGYYFGVWRQKAVRPMPLGKVEGDLDDKGGAVFQCPAVSSLTGFKGPARVRVMASVFEAGSGRTTVANSSVAVHPDRVYAGLKSSRKTAEIGKEIALEGIVVDWKGLVDKQPQIVDLRIVEVQSDWVWEYDEDYGRSTWRRFTRELMVEDSKIETADGLFKYSFTPGNYAEAYVVKVAAGANALTDLYLPSEGYDYWWDEEYQARSDQTPRPQVPEGIGIEVADNAGVGTPVSVSLDLPYPGRLLFTVETDQVLDWRWIDVKSAGKFRTSFTLKDFQPNVYVSALLVKDPFFESTEAFIPGRAFGVRSVQIRPEKHRIAMTLTAPEEVRPNHELTVVLDTGLKGKNVFATVAAIDEGILQLTRYETPDPLSLLFEKRGLEVNTFETVGWTLLLPPNSGSQSTGGDGMEEGMEGEGGQSSRVQPIKPVALWSGMLEVGDDGKAQVTFQVPTYRGQLRVMAVAASPTRIGSASARVIVRDPLVLQATFPRFLMAEDRFVVPVFLTNMTDRDDTIEVSLKSSGNVVIEEAPDKSIALAKNQSATVVYVCRAVSSYGAADFEVVAKAGENESRGQARIPLLPNGPMTREFVFHDITPGENNLAPDLTGWSPQYEQTTVTVTSNRYGREMGHLKHLIQYPYGCIEQTTSTTRPLLFIRNILPAIDPQAVKDGSIEEKFMYGVNRLFNMQNADGGFAYWSGGGESCYWGTAYATHLLLEGLDAGYPIDRDRVKGALDFMERTLNANAGQMDRRHDYSNLVDTEPYMQFILAKAGRARTKRIRELIENPDPVWGKLKEENMFLLKAALYISGDRTYEGDLKMPPLQITDERRNDWTFWSALRTRGIMLDILEDLMPGDLATEPLAEKVASYLKNSSYHYTTQDLAWCVGGLGKRAAQGAREWSNPTLTMNGQDLEPLPSAAAAAKSSTWRISGASGAKSLLLNVDTIQGGGLFALVAVEGIKPGVPYRVGDQGIKVSRKYLDADGDPVNPDEIKLGGLIYVQLNLANLTGDRIQNVAMVDRFGAGLEIENPRLNRDHGVGWVDENSLWDLTYMNIRDDRIELFGHLNPRQEVFVVYVSRAVIGGRFTTPPVIAEAMYDPRIYSLETGEPIRVRDPWDALSD